MNFFVWFTLAAIALGMPAKSAPAPARIEPMVGWVSEGVEAEGGSLDDARIALVFAIRESGGDPLAMSADGQDCGLMQLRGLARAGHLCKEIQGGSQVVCPPLAPLAVQARQGVWVAHEGARRGGHREVWVSQGARSVPMHPRRRVLR